MPQLQYTPARVRKRLHDIVIGVKKRVTIHTRQGTETKLVLTCTGDFCVTIHTRQGTETYKIRRLLYIHALQYTPARVRKHRLEDTYNGTLQLQYTPARVRKHFGSHCTKVLKGLQYTPARVRKRIIE